MSFFFELTKFKSHTTILPNQTKPLKSLGHQQTKNKKEHQLQTRFIHKTS